MLPFNKPYLTGKETDYIRQAVESGKLSGNGVFTKRCQQHLENHFAFAKVLLTTSCTDALEMAAILADVAPGDEVIVPSYTFVSSALAFVRQGAKIVFIDSARDNPNLDVDLLEPLINSRTKVLVVVHYAGVACDMDPIMQLAAKYGLIVVEDAAQSIDSTYRGRPLGGIGHMGCYSFHDTKNIISGEGGALIINDERFLKRVEIVWEKGTNRSQFFRGEADKYGWVDIGSSFLPSEIIAAFLYAQLESLDAIQAKRRLLWDTYLAELNGLALAGFVELPSLPAYATNNAHMFYLICRSLEERTALIQSLKSVQIFAVFHYQALHKSPYYASRHDGRSLPNADRFTDCLVRLPMFFEMTVNEVRSVASRIKLFFDEANR